VAFGRVARKMAKVNFPLRPLIITFPFTIPFIEEDQDISNQNGIFLLRSLTDNDSQLSTAGTGFFYRTTKNPRRVTEKLVLKKVSFLLSSSHLITFSLSTIQLSKNM
jgi:hypothetical protein